MKCLHRNRLGTSHPLPVRCAGVLTEYIHRAAISGRPGESYQQEQGTDPAVFALQPGAWNAVRRSGTYRQLEPTGGKEAGSDTRGYFPRLLVPQGTNRSGIRAKTQQAALLKESERMIGLIHRYVSGKTAS